MSATTFNLEIANLRASGTADNFVVTWNRRSEHTYYHVYWRKERGGGSDSVGSLENNSYTITGLSPGEPYVIEVAASDSDHQVGQFTTIVATPRTPAGAPPAPPNA